VDPTLNPLQYSTFRCPKFCVVTDTICSHHHGD
jgi:hypothetical protein